MALRTAWHRLRAVILRRRLDRDLREEMAFHLSMREAEHRARGLDAMDARAAARRQFGNVSLFTERTRDMWMFPRLETVRQDVTYALRLLRRSPAFGLVVAGTLALAIGANTVIFGFTDLLLLRPLPFGDPARVLFLYSVNAQRGIDRSRTSLADFLDWRAQASSFSDVAAFTGTELTLTGTGDPLRVTAFRTTANLFDVWQLRPTLGRTFLPNEDGPVPTRSVVLSHRFWAAHFNSDPAIVGQPITMGGESYTIVGILTPDIEVGSFESIDVWLPLSTAAASSRRDDRSLNVVGRMNPGVSFQAASTELSEIARRLEHAHPDTNGGWTARPLRLRDAITGPDTWRILALLTIVVGFVLVVACANIANMMLARAIVRQREMAVRLALGASRTRLVRQLVTESLLLGLAGGALGLAVSRLSVRAIQATSSNYFFRHLDVSGRVLLFPFALSLLATTLFSLLPALHVSGDDFNERLKGSGQRMSGGPKGRRTRTILVVSQLALALMLLIVATLASRTVAAVKHEPLGLQTANVLTFEIDLEERKYPQMPQTVSLTDQILRRVEALPGVRTAAAMTTLPFVSGERVEQLQIAGRPRPAPKDLPWANSVVVSPEYLRTFDLPLLSGRPLSAHDDATSPPVALISREAARRYWPGGSPIGERLLIADTSSSIEIVGVVDDVKGADPTDPVVPRIYRPLAQRPVRSLAVAIRTTVPPASLVPAVRDALRSADRDLAVSRIQSLDETLREHFAENDVLVGLFGSFALLALVLAGTGLYGVTSYGVSQRTREIGIRMALGATQGSVRSLVIAQNAVVVAVGAVVGVGGGLFLAQGMRSVLYRVGTTDPLTFGGALAVLAAVAIIASYVPVRRASRVDPLTALRQE